MVTQRRQFAFYIQNKENVYRHVNYNQDGTKFSITVICFFSLGFRLIYNKSKAEDRKLTSTPFSSTWSSGTFI